MITLVKTGEEPLILPIPPPSEAVFSVIISLMDMVVEFIIFLHPLV
jgi:hypothetical protein